MALRLGKQLRKFVSSEGYFRFPAASHWMCHNVGQIDSSERFSREVWQMIGDALLHGDLKNRLISSTNDYEAAERLRNRCNFLQEHYLSDILSMVRVMVGELRWMKWIPTSSYAGRIEFSDANIRSFYRTLSQRQWHHQIPYSKRSISNPSVIGLQGDTNDIYILWDYDSIHVPAEFEFREILFANMVSAVRKYRMKGNLTIEVFVKEKGYAMVLPTRYLEKLFYQADVTVTVVQGKKRIKNALSTRIPLKAGLSSVNRPRANYIFITGNSFYSSVMSELKDCGHNIFLMTDFENPELAELVDVADVFWNFFDCIRGLPPFYAKGRQQLTKDSIVEIIKLLKVLRMLELEKIAPTTETISQLFGNKFRDDILTLAVDIEAVAFENEAVGRVYRFYHEHRWFCYHQ